MADTIESLQADIDGLTKQVKKLERTIQRKAKKRDAMLLEKNRHHFGDIEWLINNPDMPGQWGAMLEWVTERFGGEWEGVHPSGYYPTTRQQAFDLMLHDPYKAKEDKTEKMVANVRSFLTGIVSLCKPHEDGLIFFCYGVGQHSGIRHLCYRPTDGTWSTRTIRYSIVRDEVTYPDLDAALAAARKIAETPDD